MALDDTPPERIGNPLEGEKAPSQVETPRGAAGGLTSILKTTEVMLKEMGVFRGVKTLLKVNQKEGFDCPSCAWPDPEHRGAAEFCENGAKAVAHEATTKRLSPGFFAEWPISRLAEQSDMWLEAQGRLTEPLYRAPGADHYIPVSWEEAIHHVSRALLSLENPDEAVFYTSGRTSNEAAFLYQLFVREFGTNNLPDCSNMCHESSGVGLLETIGVGKGTVSLADFEQADAIFLIGQNPGTNHPRMLTTLQAAARRGCRIVSINPLRERALVAFTHPQEVWNLLGNGTPIADTFVQVQIGGDIALLKGVIKEILAEEERRPGEVLDRDFLRDYTRHFEEMVTSLESVTFDELEQASGCSRAQMANLAELYWKSQNVIVCWAMGLTQHRHAVGNIQEIVNLLLLRGNIGRPGAGVCPVRGHSNVQGDRTMGINEHPRPTFLKALAHEFSFEPPAEPGVNTIQAIQGMAEGRLKVFLAMGGNFASAAPDTQLTLEALRRCTMTTHVATKLNRTHVTPGESSVILPCLGRTERDTQASGPQFVTVENSMSVVSRSQGQLPPASEHLRSEVAIVAALARATLGQKSQTDWEALAGNYDHIRDHISRVVPGFQDFNQRVRVPGGFVLPSGARTRAFDTPDARAHFTPVPLPRRDQLPGEVIMMTIRTHDQFNTTIYGEDDRYRGIYGGRRVVLVSAEDQQELGLHEGQKVHLTYDREDIKRVARDFRVVTYDIPRGCVATYFPETNVLVPISRYADRSFTPASKSIPIKISPATP